MRQALECTRCGSPTAAGQRFCGTCGSTLSTNCPRCGTYIHPGDRFCENCGASASAAVPQQPGTVQQQPGWSQQQMPYTPPPPMAQPGYAPPTPQQVQRASVESLPKAKFGITSVLLLIGSIILIISPSLVWFKAPFISAKGSDLGDVSSLLGLIGESFYARGEYFIILGAIALILTIVSFFMLKKRGLIAAIIGISAVICLLMGIEATVKLMDEVTTMGEGIFLMFGSSLLLLIGSFKLP